MSRSNTSISFSLNEKSERIYEQIASTRIGYFNTIVTAFIYLDPVEGADYRKHLNSTSESSESDYPTTVLTGKETISQSIFNNFCSTISNLLFDPNRPKIKLDFSDEDRDKLSEIVREVQETNSRVKEEIAKGKEPDDELLQALGEGNKILRSLTPDKIAETKDSVLREIVTAMNDKNIPALAYQVVKALAVAGNCCVYADPETKTFELLKMHEYVTARNRNGELFVGIIRERVLLETLSEEQRQVVSGNRQYNDLKRGGTGEALDTIDKFTRVQLMSDGKYMVTKNYRELDVHYSKEFTEDDLPYRFLATNLVTGEHYGSGFAVDKIVDLQRLSKLDANFENLVDVLSKTLLITAPGTSIDKDKLLEDLKTGGLGVLDSVLPHDLQVMSLSSGGGSSLAGSLQALQAERSQLLRDIRESFGIHTPRTGERVTAEEVNISTNRALSNIRHIFPYLGVAFQRFVYKHLLNHVLEDSSGSTLSIDQIKYTTGDQIIDWTNQTIEINRALGELQTVAVVSQSNPFVNLYNFSKIILENRSLNTNMLLKTKKTVMEEQKALLQQQQQQQQQQE